MAGPREYGSHIDSSRSTGFLACGHDAPERSTEEVRQRDPVTTPRRDLAMQPCRGTLGCGEAMQISTKTLGQLSTNLTDLASHREGWKLFSPSAFILRHLVG